MKKIHLGFTIAVLAYLLSPANIFAAGIKTLSGTITKIGGSQIIFKTTSAATYTADIANAALTRKNGASMQFSEFLVGDKVEVKGTLWPDNSISSLYIKDLSLYAHSGTFSGKITGINPSDASFNLQSKAYGDQTIHTNNFTTFSKNGSNASFADLALGMSVTVKGLWDRTEQQVVATRADGSFRLINIYFTGSLSMKSDGALTVIGNGNVIYGVDISKATFLSKNSKPMATSEFKPGDALRVWGKHISGAVQITGIKIIDSSVSK